MAQWLLCGAGPVVMIRHVSHVWRRSEWRIKYLEKTPSCRFNCLQRWGLEKFPYFQVICAAPQTSLTCLVVALARLIVWLILWRVSGVLCMGTLGAVTTFHALEKFIVKCFFFILLYGFTCIWGELCNIAIFGTFDPIICDYSLLPTANNYTIIITWRPWK